MTRRLTRDEHALWEKLRRTVEPLKRRRAAKSKPEATPARPEAVAASATPAAPSRSRRPQAASEPAVPPPALAPLEEKTLRRLGRGLVDVDARIDLHGMRQERAHAALAHFLRRQQAHGAKIVLVVTGKGRGGEEGRGVLRHSVPAWLSGPDFRHLVGGFEEAHRRHGGAGALYVRVRRRREARRPREA